MTSAREHMAKVFPLHLLRGHPELQSNINEAISDYADYVEVLSANLYKVLIVNLSYMGPEHAKLHAEVKACVLAVLSLDDAKTCAIVIAPTVACQKLTYDEDALDSVTQGWLDDLRDGNAMKVREITLLFDPQTQWSSTRRHAHKAFMCISKKHKDYKFVSHFANSHLWVRHAPDGLVKIVPRHELVDPTWRIQTADRGNLSTPQERKQWITGVSLYTELGKALWTGMGLSPKAAAAWLDAVPYDGTLPIAVMSRSGVPETTFPREMVASFLWLGDSGRKQSMNKHLEKVVINSLKSKCMAKEYSIEGAPDISTTSTSVVPTKMAPTYDENTFKITKPMADKSLPLRKSFVDKWSASDVPENFRDFCKAASIRHNAKYNKSAIPYSGEAGKRKAEEDAQGASVPVLKPGEGDATTIEAIEKEHGATKSKALEANPKSKLLCADDGTLFLQTGDEDELFLAEDALHTFSGEFFIGKDLEKQKKEGPMLTCCSDIVVVSSSLLYNGRGRGIGVYTLLCLFVVGVRGCSCLDL